MADLPTPDRGGLPCFQVHCDGRWLPQDALLVSLQVRRAFGSVASARLVLMEGEMSTDEWPLADAGTFKPGVLVRIAAGYDGSTAPIFEGAVTRLGTCIAGDGGSKLVVECRDKAVQMTLGRKNARHLNLTDGQLIARLAQASGLATDVEATPIEHPAIVQQDCTDWDLAMARAGQAGLLVLTHDGQIVARAPQASAAAVLDVARGRDLLEWQAELAAPNPLSGVPTAAWAALARIHGRMKFRGSALALPGKLVTVSGLGKRFSGDVFVTAIEHELADGHWTTRAEFGLADECFTSRL